MKLAYVEDDLDARTIYAQRLGQEGHTCEAFSSAEDFLAGAGRGQFDLLIIDIRLPGMDGVRMLRELRQRQIFTPAILITAFNTVDYAREALNSQANYLLEKPFTFASLRAVMRKILDSPRSLQDYVDRGLATLGITRREEEVARLLLKGLSNKEIAQMAEISEKTVKQYVTQIFTKAKVSSRGEFFSWIFPV